MAEMTTVLVQRSDSADAREFQAPSHSLTTPFTVRQKRVAPKTLTGRATDNVSILRGGVDNTGVALSIPLTMQLGISRQANMSETDLAAAIALFRELVASTNFDAIVRGQSYIQ